MYIATKCLGLPKIINMEMELKESRPYLLTFLPNSFKIFFKLLEGPSGVTWCIVTKTKKLGRAL